MTRRTGKSFKDKTDYSKKDLKSMKKRLAIFTILFPIILGLVVVENFFTSNHSWKVAIVEFVVEYWQTLKLVFGGKAYDYSIEIADYSFRVDAKRFKFDVKVAQELAYKFGRHSLYFGKVSYPSVGLRNDDVTMKIHQTGEDSFKLYYDKFKWSKSIKFNSSYSMTAEQLLTVVKTLEKY